MLQRQKELYLRALTLEEELAEEIAEKQFKLIRENSKLKSKNQKEIEAAFAELLPLLQEVQDESGNIPDEDVEKIRQEIKATLDNLGQIQQNNMENMILIRAGMLEEFRGSRLAKQVAKGYKPSRERIRSKLDTKS